MNMLMKRSRGRVNRLTGKSEVQKSSEVGNRIGIIFNHNVHKGGTPEVYK